MSWAVVQPSSRHDLESTILGGLVEAPKMLVHRRRLRRTGQVRLRSMSLAVTPKALLRSRFQLGDIEATLSTRKATSMWRSSLSFVTAEMMRTTAAKRQERLPRRPRRGALLCAAEVLAGEAGGDQDGPPDVVGLVVSDPADDEVALGFDQVHDVEIDGGGWEPGLELGDEAGVMFAKVGGYLGGIDFEDSEGGVARGYSREELEVDH